MEDSVGPYRQRDRPTEQAQPRVVCFDKQLPDRQAQTVASQGDNKQALPSGLPARLLAGCSERPEIPSDLAAVVAAWPTWPEHVRKAILTLAGGST
jgi:hypothetical protein